MKYKAVLFDFDGTLADTLSVCFYSFQTIFKKYDGRTLSKKEMIEMFGKYNRFHENLLSNLSGDHLKSWYYRRSGNCIAQTLIFSAA